MRIGTKESSASIDSLNRLCKVANGDIAYFIAWFNTVETMANGACIPGIKALVELRSGNVVALNFEDITFIDDIHEDLILVNDNIKHVNEYLKQQEEESNGNNISKWITPTNEKV